MLIGIDASRANKPQKTGTEWYSYFLIEEMKRLSSRRAVGEVAIPMGLCPYGTSPEGMTSFSLRSRSYFGEVGSHTPRNDKSFSASPREEQDVGARDDAPDKFILYSRAPLEGDLGILPPNFESRVLKWSPRLLWTQIRLSWEMLVRPPDVLFVPAHALPLFSRAKMVVTIHDVGFRVYPQLYSWKDILYHRFSTWFASKFAHRIICPSEFTKRELIRFFGTDEKKIKVIHHGFEKVSEHQNGRLRSKDILFVGRLEEKKNILGIIRAFEILAHKYDQARLILVGSPGYGFSKINNAISVSEFKDRIFLKGYVDADETEKARLYQNSALLVFPTFYEGFGMPILEAQSCGCPVVTSNFGANKEVAGNAAIFVDPKSPEDIARGCGKILSDDAAAARISLEGFKNLERFDWRVAAQDTLSCLKS